MRVGLVTVSKSSKVGGSRLLSAPALPGVAVEPCNSFVAPGGEGQSYIALPIENDDSCHRATVTSSVLLFQALLVIIWK